jgi:hypothetical protein
VSSHKLCSKSKNIRGGNISCSASQWKCSNFPQRRSSPAVALLSLCVGVLSRLVSYAATHRYLARYSCLLRAQLNTDESFVFCVENEKLFYARFSVLSVKKVSLNETRSLFVCVDFFLVFFFFCPKSVFVEFVFAQLRHSV